MPANPVAIDQITGIYSFLETVDWSEPWLWGLGAGHVGCVTLTFLSLALDSVLFQSVLFSIYLIPVYAMEQINEWAASNYKLFSREQYFDDKGLFVSVLVSAPLLVNACIFIFYWLYQTYKMLIYVQKAKTSEKSKHAASKPSEHSASRATEGKKDK